VQALATVIYEVVVQASYRRTSGELVDLPISPEPRFVVQPGTSTHTLQVEIGPCLVDDLREQVAGASGCHLVIGVRLVDEADEIVAIRSLEIPGAVQAGGTVSVGPIELGLPPQPTPILLDPVTVDFATTADAGNGPGAKTVTISTTEGGTLTGLSVGPITYRPSGTDWLQVPELDHPSASSGAPALLTLQPQTTELEPGDYSATVSIAAAGGASNSPQTISVTYHVDPVDAPPAIVLTPASVNFGPVPRSEPAPPAQTVAITSSTGASLGAVAVSDVKYEPADVPPWLNLALDPNGAVIVLAPNTTDLEPGTYTATTVVSSSLDGVVAHSLHATYIVQPPVPLPPSRIVIALQPSTVVVGQDIAVTATVTAADGTVFTELPLGASIEWRSSDPTVVSHPTRTGVVTATATGLRPDTASVDATLTLADGTPIPSNTVPVIVDARQFTVSLVVSGDGAGTVTSLESSTPGIECTRIGFTTSGQCEASYVEGQTITLRASPQAGSLFEGWGEACAGREGDECTLTIIAPTPVAAAFAISRAGAIAGTVRNALDATPVPGATVELRAGSDVTTGNPLATTTSSEDGSYRFSELTAQPYTVVVRALGFIDGRRTDIVVTGDVLPGQDIVLSPTLLPGETRIILRWGSLPSDLDAHLTGPLPGGARFHVYWFAKGIRDEPPFALLDHDERNGHGPETVTIAQQSPGVYRYSVHDYSSRFSLVSDTLGNSGAVVQVLQGNRLVRQFDVPPTPGTLWTVFELDGTTITPINRMTFLTDPGQVFLARPGRGAMETDAALIEATTAPKPAAARTTRRSE
jgi:hypothetical protein